MIIDLSVALSAGIRSGPPGLGPEIDYKDHQPGAREFQAMFGIPKGILRDGLVLPRSFAGSPRITTPIWMRPETTIRPWTAESPPWLSTPSTLSDNFGRCRVRSQ